MLLKYISKVQYLINDTLLVVTSEIWQHRAWYLAMVSLW